MYGLEKKKKMILLINEILIYNNLVMSLILILQIYLFRVFIVS